MSARPPGTQGRLDVELARRGLARSRTEGSALVAAGEVLVNGTVAAKPSAAVGPDDVLEVQSTEPRYASRAGHKLAGALESFPEVHVGGRRCLDAGASTGGFTDVLLRAGADRVIAVDVGHGQLVDALRTDGRVDVHEGLNVRDLTPSMIGGRVEVVVSDLSFISLTLVLEPLAGVCGPGTDLVVMVKPQFEVGRQSLPRSGVVVDPGARRRAVTSVVEAGLAAGLTPRGLARSPLPGQDGNAEFFLWLRAGATDPTAAAGSTDAASWVADHTVDWTG